jgi:hypothetical protein
LLAATGVFQLAADGNSQNKRGLYPAMDGIGDSIEQMSADAVGRSGHFMVTALQAVRVSIHHLPALLPGT